MDAPRKEIEAKGVRTRIGDRSRARGNQVSSAGREMLSQDPTIAITTPTATTLTITRTEIIRTGTTRIATSLAKAMLKTGKGQHRKALTRKLLGKVNLVAEIKTAIATKTAIEIRTVTRVSRVRTALLMQIRATLRLKRLTQLR